jgi:hypothetical protein
VETITGEMSVTLPITIAIAPAKPPYTYLGVAETMLPGVHILATTRPLAALPLALVSAHVLECALKAYLSKSGDDNRLKEQSIRHNLNKLWELAYSEGLNVQDQPPQWVNCLSHLHDKPYHLRYSTGIHGLGTPAPEPMKTELTKLIEQVRSAL